mmetsp:Transcript_151255/g.263616  ORF Transcript_151255/g.263616 Transcript_151255/m.263616 type:complete len:200 (+) Transcript_151255:52-651(+)
MVYAMSLVAVHAALVPENHVVGHAVKRAQCCHCDFSILKILPGNALDLLSINGLDPHHHLSSRDFAAVGEHLFAHICAGGGSGAGATEEGDLERTLGTLHLLIGDAEGKDIDAKHQLANCMLHSHLITDDIPAEHASVLVEVVECFKLLSAANIHLVCDGIVNTVARDLARHKSNILLVGSNDLLHNHKCNGIRALPRH